MLACFSGGRRDDEQRTTRPQVVWQIHSRVCASPVAVRTGEGHRGGRRRCIALARCASAGHVDGGQGEIRGKIQPLAVSLSSLALLMLIKPRCIKLAMFIQLLCWPRGRAERNTMGCDGSNACVGLFLASLYPVQVMCMCFCCVR